MATEQEVKDWFETVQVGDTFSWDKKNGIILTVTCVPIQARTFDTTKYKAFDFGMGNNRYWVAGLQAFFSYLEYIILDPSVIPPQETNPIIRRTKQLEQRFKNKTLPKTKMKPLPFPKGIPT